MFWQDVVLIGLMGFIIGLVIIWEPDDHDVYCMFTLNRRNMRMQSR